jgi:hypothetical protein
VATEEYENLLVFLGKNRKAILEGCHKMEVIPGSVTVATARKILGDLFSHANISIPEQVWPLLTKFAEKDGKIDYRFLVEVYKERVDAILGHPKQTS